MLNLDSLSAPAEPSADELTFDPKWSHFQTAIFRFVAGDSRSANIVAAAGSGKTTVILESMKYLRGCGNASFLAFNRSIADELRARVQRGSKPRRSTPSGTARSVTTKSSR
jgi:superfamily I DNA/RNA helicase